MQSIEPATRGVRDALLVIALACALYFPFLGHSGFAHSEGFRVYPGWEMLDTGEWVVPHLFGQAYLRKPPLVPWLHAIAASIFGRGEFVARSVSSSAIVGICVVSWWYARRWFGHRWGLWAGLSAAVMPIMYWYPPGRSAEIEPVHNFFALVAACMVLDSARRPMTLSKWMVLACCLTAMQLAKGPAALPFIMASVCGVAAARRDRRALWRPGVYGAIFFAVCVLALWWWAAWARVERAGVTPVLEPPTRFLFREGRLMKVALLPVAAIVTGLPHSAALIAMPFFVRGNRAVHAIAIAWTIVLACAFYMCLGVSNVRYVTPTLMLLPLCVGALAWWWWGGVRQETFRKSILIRSILGVLVFLAAAHITWAEHRRATRTSGKPDAIRLGEILIGSPGAGVELWGDQVVDVRPEVLYEACRRAAERGQYITPRWKPFRDDTEALVPPCGSYFIVRTDTLPREVGEVSETARMERAMASHEAVVVFEGAAHNFRYRVYRIPRPLDP